MFVADENNHRIVEFDQNMQFVKAFGSEGKGNGKKGTGIPSVNFHAAQFELYTRNLFS